MMKNDIDKTKALELSAWFASRTNKYSCNGITFTCYDEYKCYMNKMAKDEKIINAVAIGFVTLVTMAGVWWLGQIILGKG